MKDRLTELSGRVREMKQADTQDCSSFLRSQLQLAVTSEEKLSIYAMLASELQSQERTEESGSNN